MKSFNLLIFDDGLSRLGPLTDLRAVFELRTGMLTTAQRLAQALRTAPTALRVDPPMQAITAQAHAGCSINQLPDSTLPWLLVNGAAASPELLSPIASLQAGQSLVNRQQQLIAAHVSAAQARQWMTGLPHLPPAGTDVTELADAPLIRRPWDIQAQLDAALRHDLLACELPVYARVKPGVAVAGDHPIKVSPTAKLHPMVVINAEKGPVVIDDDAVIGSFAVVAGPCYVGKETIIAPQAHVRALCSIGPACVVGGEVSAIVIQGHSNKGHAGYLGNSFVGEWVNLGADTNASNLKNTYGPVRMGLTADGPAENSGLPKLGPVIGDFVRTAIGSRLLTGSCISTGAMLAVSSFAPKFVERFAFLTDEGSQAYDMDKFIQTARHMMGRREVPLSEAMEERLRELARISK